ncbi:FMN adenylyltransferase KNAG_0K01850 [Huiozyma naganishii CBS 8797]|uniref:FAD synthase n=1 Tax=Huiozyma naganishii (strain ATCC MYA-139 / BCRC 22969 / CBS 8797 / KCTC 17520 / NBRC 10181 / NCYC 3082 / Yp74L-3) TaxID=1071383 RepID=J7SA92_HUIN7|nr:hypothetical protein KNAG_0K01850 [Kazachstania naganishii CBS 8797]CCK72549.1 hypothetical protein KNAG_0K01850 [Kazachstania naganishii CBS 8797]
MTLAEISRHCYELAQSYLDLDGSTLDGVINETQNAIRLTRDYFLEDIFTRWSPLDGEISFSYNGGKDCQVLLLLYLGCLWEFFVVQAGKSQYALQFQLFPMHSLPSVFINLDETFPILYRFINESAARYHLELYESCPQCNDGPCDMPSQFRRFLDGPGEGTRAIVIGVRYTDPFGDQLEPIQRTDSNWPDFVRLQPLLHWRLSNVWSFLLYSGEPISELYKVGFTSIGSIEGTTPNPHLLRTKHSGAREKEEGRSPFQWEIDHRYIASATAREEHSEEWLQSLAEQYLPGWYLTDDSLERAGRLKKGK